MSTIEHVTISELEDLLRTMQVPSDTHMTITLEDSQEKIEALKRQKAIEAMQKLRGSGNGNLVTALLREREKDALL